MGLGWRAGTVVEEVVVDCVSTAEATRDTVSITIKDIVFPCIINIRAPRLRHAHAAVEDNIVEKCTVFGRVESHRICAVLSPNDIVKDNAAHTFLSWPPSRGTADDNAPVIKGEGVHDVVVNLVIGGASLEDDRVVIEPPASDVIATNDRVR